MLETETKEPQIENWYILIAGLPFANDPCRNDGAPLKCVLNWPPNPPFQLTPLRLKQDRGDFDTQIRLNVVPIYRCDAADA